MPTLLLAALRRLVGRGTAAWLLMRSLGVAVIAAARGTPGMQFGAYGRLVGLRVLAAGHRDGLDLLLTPVNIVRYWEFPFVLRHLPASGDFLDVGSPRLLAFYVASNRRGSRVRMVNPDGADAETTRRIAGALGLGNLVVDQLHIATLRGDAARYDAIWSISVVEHIPDDGDLEAMAVMYDTLAPGGRLLVTVPVDRRSWVEYRRADPYGLGVPREADGYFFQRWYDEPAIRSRLLSQVPSDARVELGWFGERVAGRFAAYERDWMRRGHHRTVSDPLEISRWYRSFPGWREMPGQGVCGISLVKSS